MKIASEAFQNNSKIPSKYTCDGENVNPPLSFSDIPSNAKSLVLIVDDPDAPSKVWVHWVLYNINPKVSEIKGNSIPQDVTSGITDFGNTDYGGPCPPSGTHRYFFKLYALDVSLNLKEGATKQQVEKAMQTHILSSSEIIGIYGRQFGFTHMRFNPLSKIAFETRKKIRRFAANKMVEHMDENQKSFLMKRIWQDHLLRYKFASKYVKDKTVLDIACGEGYGTNLLSKMAKKVTGVDLSRESIAKAEVKYKTPKNIKFTQSDALSFLKKGNKKYDVIVSFDTIEHIKKYDLFLALLCKSLKGEGILLLSTPEKKFSDFIAGGTYNPFHVKEFYLDELKALCTKVFSNSPVVYFQRPVRKRFFVFWAFKEFFLTESSSIRPAEANFLGMDIVMACRKTDQIIDFVI